MSNEDYLRELLSSQDLTRNQIENLKRLRDVIVDEITNEPDYEAALQAVKEITG